VPQLFPYFFLLQCFIGGSYSCSCSHTGSTSVILTTTCAQTCRSCAILGPQVGPKLAHARLNLRLSMVKFGPSRVRLGSRRPVFSPHPQLNCACPTRTISLPHKQEATRISSHLLYPAHILSVYWLYTAYVLPTDPSILTTLSTHPTPQVHQLSAIQGHPRPSKHPMEVTSLGAVLYFCNRVHVAG